MVVFTVTMHSGSGCTSSHRHGEDGGSCCTGATPSVRETVEEMDFQRGIWSAALDGDLNRVRSLIQKGTDPNLPDNFGYTALAAEGGHLEMCNLLLKHCDRLHEMQDGRGQTAADLAPPRMIDLFPK